MEKTIGTEVLNERLRFCERTRAELVAEINKKRHCTDELLKGSMTKDDRPVYYEINRLAETVTAAWVRERRAELADEIGEDGVDVLFVDSPCVAVLRYGVYVGNYDPNTHRIYH